MADAERGLGRPEKALELANSPEADTLDQIGKVELAIVASGARADLGEFEAGLAVLDKLPPVEGDLALRVLMAKAAVLQAAGRFDEAKALLSDFDEEDLDRAAGVVPDEIYVYETFEEPEVDEDNDGADTDASDGTRAAAGDVASAAANDDDEIIDAELVEPEADAGAAPSENPNLEVTWTPAPPDANAELEARLAREQGPARSSSDEFVTSELADEYRHEPDDHNTSDADDEGNDSGVWSDDERSVGYDDWLGAGY